MVLQMPLSTPAMLFLVYLPLNVVKKLQSRRLLGIFPKFCHSIPLSGLFLVVHPQILSCHRQLFMWCRIQKMTRIVIITENVSFSVYDPTCLVMIVL